MVCRMRERGTDSTSPSIWRTAAEPGGAGAGPGGAVGAATRGWTFCPGAPISAMLAPIGALFPSSTRICSKTPASSASMSTLTLSVSISAMGSPLATGSPGRFFHFSTFPSVIASPIFGMMTSATGSPSNYPLVFSQRLLHGRDNVRLVRHRPHFERAGVGHRDVGPGDALDRRVQLIECVFIDTHRNFGSVFGWCPLLLDIHLQMCARYRLNDG